MGGKNLQPVFLRIRGGQRWPPPWLVLESAVEEFDNFVKTARLTNVVAVAAAWLASALLEPASQKSPLRWRRADSGVEGIFTKLYVKETAPNLEVVDLLLAFAPVPEVFMKDKMRLHKAMITAAVYVA